MMPMKRRSLVLLALSVMVGAIACSRPESTPLNGTSTPNAAVNLTISAAASVQDAMRAVQAAYADVAPEVTITYNFGSSGSLAQQIAQGAPTDVFLSASTHWMEQLEAQGQLLEGSRQELLQNDLVLVIPETGSAVTDFSDLTADGVAKVAIGEPDSVPAGRYAKEALTALNLFDGLQPKFVFAKTVRQVLSYVETGNVDAGLVYATDAQISGQVKVAAIAPAETHTPIVYPIAVVADSAQADAAQAFVTFLSSEAGVTLFQDHGFGTVD